MPMSLASDPSTEATWTKGWRTSKKYVRKVNKSIMRSHKVEIPRYDMPIRLRPWFIVFTAVIMLILAFLGFTNAAHGLPINNKLLHFFCLCLATGVFYFIFDVEEDARRIWFWRSAPLIFTGVTCFFLGGIVSEFVHSLLPYKTFQIGDIAANLLGSSLGLYIAYYLERYYRHRREISRLYQPLQLDADQEEDDIEIDETPLLPSHFQPGASRSTGKNGTTTRTDAGKVRLDNVWDEGEELFNLGDDSDDDEPRSAKSSTTPHFANEGSVAPKIVVTDSDP
ncbi:hypothetical protein FOMPIDRAFT_1156744 [Fomitopsis schrenkii]|uniref:VanZ-like domain-containing protein n=1 Tax=Fomitopsis schrenkii TaxID=2126942 RepID=S8EH95_FOMSC|nr:hypothetical protein FOMPIDRAFT_1156744 [Fomitopsis schrenkii]